MLVVAAVSMVIGGGTWLAGAWPVFGFMGLDVLLVYLALRASFRSARVAETLVLDSEALRVERQDRTGRRSWRLQPAWLKVELPAPHRPSAPILLRSHGQTLGVGAFLAPERQHEIARELESALDRWRRPDWFAERRAEG